MFRAVKEFKEQLIEWKRCKKEYPSNNFFITSNQTYSKEDINPNNNPIVQMLSRTIVGVPIQANLTIKTLSNPRKKR